MSAQHTPGQIRYEYEPGYCGELIAQDGMTVAAFDSEPSEADARRLVACWNACEGLHTESLECGKPLADQLVDALNQRDELRAENKQLKATQYGSGKLQALRDQRDNMLAALTAAKRLFDEALPKFNWGASALDANAIRLLNEVPRLVQDAIAKTGGSA